MIVCPTFQNNYIINPYTTYKNSTICYPVYKKLSPVNSDKGSLKVTILCIKESDYKLNSMEHNDQHTSW